VLELKLSLEVRFFLITSVDCVGSLDSWGLGLAMASSAMLIANRKSRFI
jgi:hypothetical protein